MNIILASSSPRRKELLNKMGLEFKIIVSDVNEVLQEDLEKEEQAKRLAFIKAKKVFDITTGDRVVIGADTIVVKDNVIYGKQETRQDAMNTLHILSNDYHEVICGLCVLIKRDGQYKEYRTYDKTKVHIKQMSQVEIEKWLDMGEYKDKAAAYAIQSIFGALHIDKIEGNYESTIGLPTHQLYDILKGEGII